MIKNNRKKAVAQTISTAVALGWMIMQVESAQAATLVVNNLNDSGVGSLRETINIANSNDVVEFLLGSYPSTIALTSGALAIANNLTINGPGANLLTISGNNHFPVFDISGANVTLSRLAIAGNINAYNSSNLTLINSTINGEYLQINGGLTGIDDSNVTALSRITINGNLTSSRGNLTISTGSLYINGGKIINSGGNLTISAGSLYIINSRPAGSITVTASDTITITGSDVLPTRVPKPSAIAAGKINSPAGGNISINSGTLILTPGSFISKPVPEPSAIAGTILAGSLAWLAKRKQAAFPKTKV